MSELSWMVLERLGLACPTREADQWRDHSRHLHDGVVGLLPMSPAGAHDQVVALVEDLGEGMARIHGQRREHWEDLIFKILACPFRIGGIEIGHVEDMDVLGGEGGFDLLVPELVLRADQFLHARADHGEKLGRGDAVRAGIRRATFDELA
ncbi:MAG: hypothetical protein QM796_16620 [Chthoniobacteraceae bacterium]